MIRQMASQIAQALTLGGIILAFAGNAAGAELPTRPYLPLDKAVAMVEHAVATCADKGYAVSATVVGPAGVTKALHRADGAGSHTIYSSSRKAFTAASLGVSTAELAQIAAENPTAAGLRDMSPRILILGGGLPIKADGTVVGGIGVGGTPSGETDEACAQTAIKAVVGDKP